MGWSGTPEEVAAKRAAYFARPEVRERLRAWGRERYKDPEYRAKIKKKNRELYHRKYGDKPSAHTIERRARLYGVSVHDLNAMLENPVCGICGATGDVRWHIDHDHNTNEVRGLLCPGCNTGLGWVEKDGWLEKTRAYLDK